MKLKTMLLTVGLLALSAPVLAFHCPADMKKIDAAMAGNPDLTEEQMSEVKSLRAEGEDLHKAGRHAESVETLARVMSILNIQ